MDARGATCAVQVVFTVVRRRELEQVVGLIHDFDPNAFYAVNDLQATGSGIVPAARPRPGVLAVFPLRLFRPAA